jgi:UDP-N-acetylglucosamine:LPS N-acetylglucosamine transferase
MQEYDFTYHLVFGDYYPVGYSTLAAQKPEEARSRIDHCQRIAQGDEELEDIISTFNPQLIIAGYFIALEALLVKYCYDIPFIITTTFLRHPDEDPAIASIRFLTYHAPEISLKLMNTADPLATSKNYTGTLESYRAFVEPMENESMELITCPEILDYPEAAAKITGRIESEYPETATSMICHYIEPSIVKESDTGFDPGAKYKVVFATAGSRVRDYLESARRLFKILERMIGISGMENRYLNLAVGHDLQEDFLNKKRIRIAPGWASQTADLPNAKSAVVHGGLATIKECIFYGVPPIIVPLGKDQMDNAQRILLHKVGVLAMLDTLDEFKIAKAILDAENDPDVRKNIQKMRAAFIAMENSPPSVAIINQFLDDLT